MRNPLFTTFALFLMVLAALVPASAQSNYAVLGGIVLDPQQATIPDASIQLTATATGTVRRVTSNSLGIFQIPGLLPGEYGLVVEAPGFSRFSRPLRLDVGQQVSLDVNMTLATVIGNVSVSAESAEVLRTTDASVGEVIEPAAIRNLPLNGRLLIDLVLTVPGAHVGHGAQTGDMNPLYWRPGQRSAVSVGGNRPNANYFLLDGATNTDPTFNTSVQIGRASCRERV